MVARTQPIERSHLIVTFGRYGEQTIRVHCNSGEDAADVALGLIAKAQPLRAGDILSVQHGDPGSNLPEPSRASHTSG